MIVYVLECHEEENSRVVGVFSALKDLEAYITRQAQDNQAYSSLALEVDQLRQTAVQVFYNFLTGWGGAPDRHGWHAATPEHTWRRL